jgi:hypothetical protein
MPLGGPLRAGATLAVLAAAACMSPRWAQAADPGYQIQVGVEESDNIQRLPSGGTDETMAFQEVNFDWHEKRPLFDADIDADLSHLTYLQNAYGDQVLGNFIGTSKINIVPELFSWSFADNFGQTPLYPLAPITPANQENINYFSTGPQLTLPLAPELQLDVSGQYGRVNYLEEALPLDSNRLSGSVALVHELSPNTNISINAKDERTDFQDDQLNPDFQRQEAFVRFDTKGSRTQIAIDVGYGLLEFPGVHDGSFVARLDVTRRVSPNSTLGLALGHEYSDGADSFLLIQTVAGAGLNTPTAIENRAPFVIDYAVLAWNFQRERTTAEVFASYFRDDYTEASTLNNDLTLAHVRAARELSPVLQLAVTEYLDREHFTAGGDSATEADTGLQLTWRAGKSLSVIFAYYLAKGFSDLPTDRFTENRLWLSVGYGRAAEVPAGPAPLRLPGQAAN